MAMFRQIQGSVCRALRLAGLGLTVFVVAAPVYVGEKAPALDREELTGRLVPVTGESQRSVDLTVPFARNSARLAAAAREQLDELGAALGGERLAPFSVGVYGHTDASGRAAYNQKLSQKRAAAVVQYLVQGFSLDPKRFRAAGYGEERLLEGIDADSPRHRRVEIVVFSPVPRNAPEPGASPAPRATGETPGTPGVPSTESAWPDAGGEPPRPQEGGSGVRVIN